MRLPVIEGIIRRRILLNYRVDPRVMQPLLPQPFRPKLHAGFAIVGVCLIRLEKIRPLGWPSLMGIASENAAHRVAVEWDAGAETREGVFIPRRDTNSLLNHYAGGRIFPGEHHFADFTVRDRNGHIGFRMISHDRLVKTELRASEATVLPQGSVFASPAEASAFFEPGCVGWSACKDPQHLDGLRLKTYEWAVRPLAVEIVRSSFFADPTMFPAGSVEFDHALLMRDIRHEWHSEGRMLVRPSRSIQA